MRLKENIKDFIAVAREYKKFFVPKYCSAATFYLFLVISLILPRKLFKMPNEQGNRKDDELSKHFLKSLSEDDKELLKKTFVEYYDDKQCAKTKRA